MVVYSPYQRHVDLENKTKQFRKQISVGCIIHQKGRGLNKAPLAGVAIAVILFLAGGLIARSGVSLGVGLGMMFLALLVGLGLVGWAVWSFTRMKGSPSTGPNGAIICPMCKVQFNSQNDFDAHWSATHVNPDSFYIPS